MELFWSKRADLDLYNYSLIVWCWIAFMHVLSFPWREKNEWHVEYSYYPIKDNSGKIILIMMFMGH